MTTHSYHPDTHENGLADNCERCLEHAQEPFDNLDDENLTNLIIRVQRDDLPRSSNEMTAMNRVSDALRLSDRLLKIRDRVMHDLIIDWREGSWPSRR